MKRKQTWLKVVLPVLTVLWIVFILTRSLKTGKASHAESVYCRNLLQRVCPGISMYLVRKGAHFIEFFVLGLLLFWDVWLFRRRSFWIPALAGLVIAVSDEMLQRIIPERSGELADILLDLSGVILACLAALGISALLDQKRGRKHE